MKFFLNIFLTTCLVWFFAACEKKEETDVSENNVLSSIVKNINKNNKEIEGAFGIKLGDIFDVASKESSIQAMVSETIYEIMPPDSIEDFKDYYISITQNSHRISEIRGVQEGYSSGYSCFNKVGLLKEVLGKKYGTFFSYSSQYEVSLGDPIPRNGYILTADKRNIIIECSRYTDKKYRKGKSQRFNNFGSDQPHTLQIIYEDTELKHLSQVEEDENRQKEIKENVKSIDSSKL